MLVTGMARLSWRYIMLLSLAIGAVLSTLASFPPATTTEMFHWIQTREGEEGSLLDIAYEIERQGDRLIITPVGPPLTNALELFTSFSDGFMPKGRPDQGTQEYDLL